MEIKFPEVPGVLYSLLYVFRMMRIYPVASVKLRTSLTLCWGSAPPLGALQVCGTANGGEGGAAGGGRGERAGPVDAWQLALSSHQRAIARFLAVRSGSKRNLATTHEPCLSGHAPFPPSPPNAPHSTRSPSPNTRRAGPVAGCVDGAFMGHRFL